MTSPQRTTHELGPGQLYGLLTEIQGSIQAIAVLSERNAQSERRMAENEARATDAMVRVEQQIVRVHERLDEMRTETSNQIQTALAPFSTDLAQTKRDVQAVRGEVDAWINRGKGAWWVASIFAGVVQAAVLGALVWLGGEVKALHDWRIQVEAQRVAQSNSAPK